jgi:hypothetical protein
MWLKSSWTYHLKQIKSNRLKCFRWYVQLDFNHIMFLHLYIHFIGNLTLSITVWQIPDAVDTVVCAPDDGWRYHPKHVQPFPNINKLCKIASCWIYSYIGIYLRCAEPWTLNIYFHMGPEIQTYNQKSYL